SPSLGVQHGGKSVHARRQVPSGGMTSPPSTSTTPPPPPAPPPVGGLLRRESIPNLLTVGRLVLAVALFAVLTPWRIGESAAAAGRGVDPWLLGAAALFIVAA